MEWNKYNIIESLVCRIIDPNRRKIHNVNYRKENIFLDFCQTDIVNHLDTQFFSRKFCPIIFESKKCTMFPFLD